MTAFSWSNWEANPAQYMPDVDEKSLSEGVVRVDLNLPMDDILAELGRHPVKTRLSLNGPIIVRA